MKRSPALCATLAFAILLPACGLFSDSDRVPKPPPPPAEPPPSSTAEPLPSPTPGPPEEPGRVQPASEEIRVRAWSEPRILPPAGGQAQILVLVRKRQGGDPLPGVQVRLVTTEGTLFSGGKLLTTDASGRTRDRITTRHTAVVTVNAGGTVQSVLVPVGSPPPPSR
jgi:hypothetical protein